MDMFGSLYDFIGSISGMWIDSNNPYVQYLPFDHRYNQKTFYLFSFPQQFFEKY